MNSDLCMEAGKGGGGGAGRGGQVGMEELLPIVGAAWCALQWVSCGVPWCLLVREGVVSCGTLQCERPMHNLHPADDMKSTWGHAHTVSVTHTESTEARGEEQVL